MKKNQEIKEKVLSCVANGKQWKKVSGGRQEKWQIVNRIFMSNTALDLHLEEHTPTISILTPWKPTMRFGYVGMQRNII